ncbi:phosphoribosyltransferase family protein [Stenotrophomonas maltophilia]|uniref:phosphoribosyltransferase family protein n=1 Tax=Stenotrophomonas maltophilia TaxID=40324 RepID=UPI0009BF92DD|nr:phosphoribosyltransferase family protein [Stenotrophomonas maltophilia]
MLDIRVSANPIFQDPFGKDVACVFRRLRSKSSSDDGNPIIYALKGKNGFHIDLNNLMQFMPYFYGIVSKAVVPMTAQYVIPIPSSSKVCQMVSRRVSRKLGAEFIDKLLTKKLHRHVRADIDLLLRAGNVPRADVNSLKKISHDLGRSLSTSFALKGIDIKMRKYFVPFSLARPEDVPAGSSVLLVDDLLSTGTSLESASRILMSHGVADVSYLCLLSSTGPYRR